MVAVTTPPSAKTGMFRNPFRSRKASFVMKLGEAVKMAVPMGTTIPKRDMGPWVRVQVCVCACVGLCVCARLYASALVWMCKCAYVYLCTCAVASALWFICKCTRVCEWESKKKGRQMLDKQQIYFILERRPVWRLLAEINFIKPTCLHS